MFSFPVTIDAQSHEWKIVQGEKGKGKSYVGKCFSGLAIDDFAKQKIDITTKVIG